MSGLDFFVRSLSGVSLGLYLILISKLLVVKLYRQYPSFFLLMATQLAVSGVMFQVRMGTNLYGQLYFVTTPLILLFQVLVVLELYTLVFRKHPGIASFARRMLPLALGISVVSSLLTLYVEFRQPVEEQSLLLHVSAIERAVFLSLTVFLLVLVAVLAWYPVPMSRNLLTYGMTYSVYFLSKGAGRLIRNLMGEDVTQLVNAVQLGVACACLVYWIVALSRKGEEITVVAPAPWRADDGERLLSRLEAINSSLLKSSRR